MARLLACSTFVLAAPAALAATAAPAAPQAAVAPSESWLQKQREQSWQRLLRNLSPEGTARGTVVASPSREAPNYWFHWVRDAGLVLDQVVSRRIRAQGDEAARLDQLLWDFTALSRRQQKTPNRSGAADERGLGEPKFEVSGAPFDGEWGRPQNDSPAARALMLIRWASFLLDQAPGRELQARVQRELYDAKLPSESVIKNDLEYVASHALEPCIDLWEESWGHHFYTRILSESALREGAKLARRLGDPFAADWYEKKATELRKALNEHWDEGRKLLVITKEPGGARPSLLPRLLDVQTQEWKPSGIDSAVILGILHRRPTPGDLSWSVLDPRVQATFRVIERTFADLYPINRRSPEAPAIGRYPEDRYDGVQTGSQGHAWVLATAGFAEFLYRSAIAERALATSALTEKARIRHRETARSLVARAESYLARLQKHADPDGNWSEQLHRSTGMQRGARDLSWSHAAFLSAMDARVEAQASLQ